MKVTTYNQASRFLDAALSTLLQEEEKNNLMLGIALRVSEGHSYGEASPLFLTVHEGTVLVAAALQTPPFNMILYCQDDRFDALEAIASHLIETGQPIPGVNGTVAVASAFAQIWCQKTGVNSAVRMAQRIYTLTDVIPPEDVPGRMRWAQEEDVPKLARWFLAFCDEAVPDAPPANPEKNVRQFMRTGKLAVWDHNGIVSMTGSSRGTPHGKTISAVYTPPQHRKHGYASACVAALSQRLLDEGNRFCTLYTDLSNPISNKIYQDIGYRPIADSTMIMLGNKIP